MATNAENFSIELITENDKNVVLNFLRNSFFKDEPLCQFLDLESTPDNPEVDLHNFALDKNDNGWGYKAINEKGNIIGLSLNLPMERGAKEEEDINVSPESNFCKIKNLLDYLMEKTDIWTNNPDFKRGIQLELLSVNKDYGGQGIGTKLVEKVRQRAIEEKFDFLIVECTSHFSALIVKKLGFKLIYSVSYDQYKPKGEIVLKPKFPHLAATVWVDKL